MIVFKGPGSSKKGLNCTPRSKARSEFTKVDKTDEHEDTYFDEDMSERNIYPNQKESSSFVNLHDRLDNPHDFLSHDLKANFSTGRNYKSN